MGGRRDIHDVRDGVRPAQPQVTITPWSAIARPAPARPQATTLVSIHRLPPEERALLLAALDTAERLVLSRVCCGGAPLSRAASELGISYQRAKLIWERVSARLS